MLTLRLVYSRLGCREAADGYVESEKAKVRKDVDPVVGWFKLNSNLETRRCGDGTK